MLNNYFTIKQVAKYLNENISGSTICEIYSQEKNKLIIATEKENAVFILEYSIDKDYNYLILKNNFSKAKKNVVNLFQEIYGRTITGFSQYKDDRAIAASLDDGSELIFIFFRSNANMFLIMDSKVVNSFKEKSEFAGTDASGIIPVRHAVQSIPENVTVAKFVKLMYPQFGNVYSNEVLSSLGIDANSILTDEVRDKLDSGFRILRNQLSNPDFILYTEKPVMSLIKLKIEFSNHKQFDNINDLLSEYIRTLSRTEKVSSVREDKLEEIQKSISLVESKIKGLKTQTESGKSSAQLRQYGEAILANIDKIKRGDTSFTIRNNNNEETVIKLNMILSPSENAQQYFDRSKKQKGSAELLQTKIDALEKDKVKLLEELNRIKNMTDTKELVKEVKKAESSKPDETSRFRKFNLNDKFEVWVGKDSASNDLLTTRHSAPNDLWFHVRGASGSHTVLKVSNKKDPVPKDMIQKAAAISAYYSKARNASSVPVAYTERKYVKKKKGFKEGTVVMEREKVIFVKPGLPYEV